MTSNALAGEQCNRHTRGDNNKDGRIGHKDMLTVQNQNQSARLLISRTKDATHLVDSPSHASRLWRCARDSARMRPPFAKRQHCAPHAPRACTMPTGNDTRRSCGAL